MLIYGKQREYTLNNFIVKRLMSNKLYWKHRLFPDHLSIKDYLTLSKSIYKKDAIIYMSLESSENSFRYYRPSYCDFSISHRSEVSFFYNLLAGEFLGGFFKNVSPNLNKNNRIAFISSNYKKIDTFFKKQTANYHLIDFYGLYGKSLPIYNIKDSSDKRPLWKKETQQLYSSYSACICIENSYQEGYLQGSYVPALMSGCVPIIDAEPYSLSNILRSECYIKFSDYLTLPTVQLIKLIKSKTDYIKGKSIEYCFTNLFNDYLSFLKQVDLDDIQSAINTSQYYRKGIIKK